MPVSGLRTLNMEGEAALPILKALANETRLLILSLLTHNSLNVSELARALNLPHSTVNFNLNQLQAAGLIWVEYEPGTRGSQKRCSRRYDVFHYTLPGVAIETNPDAVSVSMPIGNYSAVDVKPTCGLASDTKFIGMLDDTRSFFEPDHVHAQILWFGQDGFVEYAFPNNLPHGAVATRLDLSMEVCSEAPQYDLDWPSDITVWIGGSEIGTFTSPSDFGGTRGKLTPAWWMDDMAMHGMLKNWSVTAEGSFVDGARASPVTIDDLQLNPRVNNHLRVRLGVKADARHRGGLNLFGRKFGNHEQDLLLRITYTFPHNVPVVQVR